MNGCHLVRHFDRISHRGGGSLVIALETRTPKTSILLVLVRTVEITSNKFCGQSETLQIHVIDVHGYIIGCPSVLSIADTRLYRASTVQWAVSV